MKITELNGKKVCILGFGREGRSTLAVLIKLAPRAIITIADQHEVVASGRRVIYGPDYLQQLDNFDCIIKTPGLRWTPPPKLRSKVTSATQIFFNSLPKSTIVIGITGTKGKSSTAALIHHVLKSSGRPAYLAGNIGEPMLDLLVSIKADEIAVLELSSYQLNDLSVSPGIAVITSFFPDHIDYHGTVTAYFEAKSHITNYQGPQDTVFYNADFEDCRRMAQLSSGHKVGFTSGSVSQNIVRAAGRGTVPTNLAAAVLVARHLGISDDEIVKALRSAPRLAHRQQRIGTYHDITWVDDSAATTPQSTQAALLALGESTQTLIVGGLNRDYDFAELGSQIAASSVENIILFPDTGNIIQIYIEAAHPQPSKTYFSTASMDEAVRWAAQHTTPGKICLLSSGAPSYNLFENFNERGDAFQKAAAALNKD